MSVPPGDRGVSCTQFIETADNIEKRAMEVCRKWPKSFMFIITQRTIDMASSVYEHCQNANAIFPITSEAERTERIIELQRALGAVYGFARKIERAYSMFPICGEKTDLSHQIIEEKSNKLLEEFMTMCYEEEEAIRGNISYTRNIVVQSHDFSKA